MKGREVEVKLPVADPARTRRALRRLGFRVKNPRALERNTLFDTPTRELRRRGQMLRLRQSGRRWWMTFKGPGGSDRRYKIREERETAIADGQVAEQILTALGLTPTFYYEKYRTELAQGRGHALLDETPVGRFLELEGPPAWIDRVARQLGYGPRDYIRETYAALFNQMCCRWGVRSSSMSFAEVRRRFPRRAFS